jgi:hypothetical protein
MLHKGINLTTIEKIAGSEEFLERVAVEYFKSGGANQDKNDLEDKEIQSA